MSLPLHELEFSILDGLTHETFWIALSAIVSACVAIGTILLAIYTKRLAEETATTIRESRFANALADQHHQEALMPLVLVEADLIRAYTEIKGELEMPVRYEWAITLSGSISNIGPGPATSISVFVTRSGYELRPHIVSPIGPNGSKPLHITWLLDPPAASLSKAAAHVPFDVQITYTTLFGTKGMTIQYSHSGRGLDLVQREQGYLPIPSTRLGRQDESQA